MKKLENPDDDEVIFILSALIMIFIWFARNNISLASFLQQQISFANGFVLAAAYVVGIGTWQALRRLKKLGLLKRDEDWYNI
jgi:hypothetical protein